MRLRGRRAGGPAGPAGLPDLGRAPELLGVGPWINTARGEPLTLAGLSGRVVLIEFWTFACVNCVRTLPFLRRMDSRYGDLGVTVVGVHTPELPMERRVSNVERAVRERGLRFPVGLDNDFAAWKAYANRYWPTRYLLDGDGRLRHTHVGEGRYDATEAAIGVLLDARPPHPG